MSADESIMKWAKGELTTKNIDNIFIRNILIDEDYFDETPLETLQMQHLKTFAFWALVIDLIEQSLDLSFKKHLSHALDSILLEDLNTDIFVRKVRNKIKQCIKKNDYSLLLQSVESNVCIVGQSLTCVGITEKWLEKPEPVVIDRNLITKEVILDLRKYKYKHNLTINEMALWIKHILNLTDIDMPNYNSLRSQVEMIYKKSKNLRGDWEKQKSFLKSVYTPTKPCQTCSNSSTLETGSVVVTDQNYAKVLNQNFTLKSKITKVMKDKNAVQNKVLIVKKEKRLTVGKLFQARKRLQQLEATNVRCRDRLRKTSVRNNNKKLKRRDLKIYSLLIEKENLNKRLMCMQTTVKNIKNKYKNLKSLSHYYKTKTSSQKEQINQSQNENMFLMEKINCLEKENSNLCLEFDQFSDKIETYQKGKYNDEIRLVCYELLNKGVSSRNIPDVIKVVINRLTKLEIDRLPKPSLLKYMSTEAGIISKTIAAKALLESQVNTIQTDGTTKKHNKYLNFVATTDSGKLLGLGLQDHYSGDAQSQVDGLELLLNELSLNLESIDKSNVTEKEPIFHKLLLNFKNCMTDRHIVNKKFVKLLEAWREKVLPLYSENWENLDETKKTELITINDFYCGMHFVLGLQDNFETNIKEWEKMEAAGNKIGREKVLNWHRMGSATLQFVRSCCEAFGKEACEKSGKPKELAGFAQKKILLTSFKHNRFNIPFVNATFCIFHLEDMLNFVKTLGQGKNKLMKSIEADGSDPIIVSTTTAMSILELNITTPLMKLMVKENVSIIEISNYYTKLQSKLKEWSNDPTELFVGTALLFEDIPPNKNEVYEYIYLMCKENSDMIKQALAVGCKSFLVVTERMLKDHLPGGKFHDPDIQIQQDSNRVPKHNIACERFFSGLDRLFRKMPTANTIGIEGILLWSMNETSVYLDKMSEDDRKILISAARKKTPEILKLYRERKELIKIKTKEKVMKNAEVVAKKEENARTNKIKLLQFVKSYNGPINNKSDVIKLMKTIEKKSLTLKLLVLKSFIKYEKLFCFKKDFAKLYTFQAGKKKHTVEVLRNNLITLIEGRPSNYNAVVIFNSVEVNNTRTSSNTNQSNVDITVSDTVGIHNVENTPAVDDHERVVDDHERVVDDHERVVDDHDLVVEKAFEFKQSTYVAVAYNEGFYVGVVQEIVDNDNSTALIKFMKWKKQQLIWPQPENVEQVQAKYVLCSDLDLFTSTGRLYVLSGEFNYKTLKEKFDNYTEKYFS